jgi:hypothetical protein
VNANPVIPSIPTIKHLADAAGVEFHHVHYIVRKLGLQANDRAGITRVFSAADAAKVFAEVRRIHGERKAVKSSLSN